MSLLGPHVPVSGWTPAGIGAPPQADASCMCVLLNASSEMLHRGRKGVRALGRDLADAYQYLDARLLEGRNEAAQVRYALGLPMAAELPEVLAAIKARAS